MCAGGKKQQRKQAKAQQAMQEQSLALQREQLEMARQAQERQAAQYQEQMAIATAAPPPPPSPVADVARNALEDANAATPLAIRQGTGRRKLRTDLMAGGYGGLSIPAA
jgi:hypothetical protein